MKPPGFFAELKRRNVIRAAILYLGAVWALAQGIAQLGPVGGAPDWTTRWFLVAAAIGFPFWITFAWFYEFTPEGLKRESEIDPASSITRRHRAQARLHDHRRADSRGRAVADRSVCPAPSSMRRQSLPISENSIAVLAVREHERG